MLNNSEVACNLQQAPTLQLFSARQANHIVDVQLQADFDSGLPIVISPMQTVEIAIGTPNPDNFPKADCISQTANLLVIKFDSDPKSSEIVSEDWSACTTANGAPFIAQLTLR